MKGNDAAALSAPTLSRSCADTQQHALLSRWPSGGWAEESGSWDAQSIPLRDGRRQGSVVSPN